jgi:2-polyprenyl-6-methoxyphenol hydroxylase-like FAD-dependent oxidoreductase
MIDSLCILGGGTSGLVSALMMRQAYPNLKITMIESSQIGIIGVGEGSTEHWKKFMTHIGISLPELVREAGATFKIGIKFTNWQGDGKHYFLSLIHI